METPSGNRGHKRVLVVEDNDLNVKLFVSLVEQQGYESLSAKDGHEAIKLAKEALPDLILMDDQLPDISGLEVVRRLRAEEGTKRIPIIAVFGLCDERTALDSGCDAYAARPINVPNFLRMIESFLSESDQR